MFIYQIPSHANDGAQPVSPTILTGAITTLYTLLVLQQTTADINAEVEMLKQQQKIDLDYVTENSAIKYYENPCSACRTSDNKSIHFVPKNKDKFDDFLDLLVDELVLRGESPTGELETLRERLLAEIHLENGLCKHVSKLQHCGTIEASIMALLHKVPCILHLENRVGLKILTMLLRERDFPMRREDIFMRIYEV